MPGDSKNNIIYMYNETILSGAPRKLVSFDISAIKCTVIKIPHWGFQSLVNNSYIRFKNGHRTLNIARDLGGDCGRVQMRAGRRSAHIF